MLGTILIILGFIGLAYFAFELFWLLPSAWMMLNLLIKKRITWPGPLIHYPDGSEFSKPSLFPLFLRFFYLVGGMILNMLMILFLIIIVFPQINEQSTGRMILQIAFFAATILVGLFLIKPAYKSRHDFRIWFAYR